MRRWRTALPLLRQAMVAMVESTIAEAGGRAHIRQRLLRYPTHLSDIVRGHRVNVNVTRQMPYQ